MEKFRVALEIEERAGLEGLVSKGKAASRKLTHARILLLADASHGEAHTDEERVLITYDPTETNPADIHEHLIERGYHAAARAD